MNVSTPTQTSPHLFAAVGGWRTVAETLASHTLFLVTYLLTGHVATSALLAVGAVATFAILRIWADRKYWQPAAGLVAVGISALLAKNTGQAVDFYFPDLIAPVIVGTVFLASMLIRRPMIGVIVGAARGERFRWKHDRKQQRRYQACTAVFLAKFVITVAVLGPLYQAEQIAALGIASALFATPAMSLCIYLCWRILHAEADPSG